MKQWAFKLTRGNQVLAYLTPVEGWKFADYPAVEGAYETTTAFEPLRRLFEREVELLEIDDDAENVEWGEIWEELLKPGLFVESEDGRERIDILWIHFAAERAWWFPLYNSPRTLLRQIGAAGD